MPKSKYKKTYFTSGRISEHCMQKEGKEQRGGPVHSKRRGATHLCLQLSEYHLKYELQKHKRAKQMYRSPPCTSSLGTKGKSAWSSSALFPLIWPCDPDTTSKCQRSSVWHTANISLPHLHLVSSLCCHLSSAERRKQNNMNKRGQRRGQRQSSADWRSTKVEWKMSQSYFKFDSPS